MSNLITIEQIGTSVPTDTIVLADQTRVKAENNMWEKPLAVQPALVNLEENIVGGATEGTDTFKKVEDKILAINGNVEERYTKAEVDDKTDLTRLRTHILPENANTDIGSPTKRFRSIHVDEAYLSTNTLYIGDTPVLGTDADTITIKADVDQSILVKTIGSGITTLQSETEVNINTAGMNADVKLQANGVNSKVRLGANGGIELSSPTSAQSDLSVSGNLTLTGNFVHNGQSFTSNATTVTTKDNIIVLNQGEVGTGVTAGKAGLQIDRGDAADFQLIFDETIDKFTVGIVGGVHEVLSTREYVDAGLSNIDVYTLPTATNTVLGGIKVGAGLTIVDGTVSVNGGGVADSVDWSGVINKPTTLNGYGILDAATSTHIHTDASVTVSGFMSASDKVKLNGLSNYIKPSAEPISYITNLQTTLDSKATTTALDVEKGRIDAILLSAGASTDTFAEIVTLINSVDTTNDTAFSGYVTSNNARSATIETTLGNKVDKVTGKQLSTEDYTSTEKTKLAGIAAGAQVNVATDLSLGTATATVLPLNSSTGNDVNLPSATTTTAGLLSATDKTKLDGVAANANNYVLPTASSTVNGGVKVSSTTQTVAANAVTTTASRTYAVQLDASGNALVNVPWSDTDTVYTHPTSGVTAGTYKSITVNAQGHITAGTNPTTLAGYGITDAATTTALNTEKSRIDAILSASTADKDTFAEIVSLINSVDTTNDTAFSGYVTSNNARSTTIETNVTNLTNNKANKATTLAGYGITIIDCGSIV